MAIDITARDGKAIQSLRRWAKNKRNVRCFEIEYEPANGPYVWIVRTRDEGLKGKGIGNNLRIAVERAFEDLGSERANEQTSRIKEA